ncbi:efflux RND transporter periplasmic adaptor subunit [Desulfonema magnum]|uniref:Efflux transporter, RND family n=1 Tax=Desulfonema magnum TaxID=45655 RepID=A0A975BTL7_9BACT|nr:efflux RND transporter periplasmic adaptor subunit [Desulfonema magnum]QTA91460.1 Efflux transporter, RND family [Desulfonema magnum]
MKTVKILLILFFFNTLAASAQPPAKVLMSKVFEKEVAKTNQIVGVVDFDKRSGISSEVSGLIDKQSVVEGTVVKKGDVLVSLNTDFIQKSIEIMKKQIQQVDIKIQNTRKNLKRYEVLFKKDAASEKVYDDLGDSYKELMKEKEIIRKNKEKLDLEIKKSVIRAPFDGLILERYKNEGEWVSPGTPICSLASIGDVFVRVAVSEELVKYIRSGDEISLKINALEKEFTGTVKNFVPVADMKSKTFQIKVVIPYFEDIIQNMSATVNVPVSNKMKLKMIKRDALVLFQGKDFVYTAEEGKAKILPVNIVAYEGEYIGVDNPYIVPGMSVVIDGNDRLRPDQAVEVIEKEK